MRQIPAYLRAVIGTALDSVGRVDLLAGLLVALVTALVGFRIMPLTSVDLTNLAIWAAVGVLAYFLFHVLLLTPARLWHEAQQRDKGEPIANYTFQAGAFAAGSSVHFHGLVPTTTTDGPTPTATATVEPAPEGKTASDSVE